MNQTKLRLLILSTLISIALSMLMYYDIFRMCRIKYFNENFDKYIRTYNQIPPIEGYAKLTASISLTDGNLNPNKLKPVVKSILDQTEKVNAIVVNVFGDKIQKNPELEKVLSVFSTGKNYGSLDALIPELMREGEKQTLIACLNDKYIYGKDFLETMVDAITKNPESIIAWQDCALVKPNFFSVSALENPIKEDENLISWIKSNSNANIVYISYSRNYPL